MMTIADTVVHHDMRNRYRSHTIIYQGYNLNKLTIINVTLMNE